MDTDPSTDANSNGLLAFPNNYNGTIIVFGGTFANGRPPSLDRVRFTGFTLSGTQTDLDALTGNETFTFIDWTRDSPYPTYSVTASSFEIGFNELPSTSFTEDVFAANADALGLLRVTTSNVVGTPNSNLRIESLHFQLIPEPSTYALLAGALALLYRISRRPR